MLRRFALILIGLALISQASRSEGGVVHLFALPAALVLYPLAYLVLLTIVASPLVCGVGLWLLWRWTRDGRLPAWVRRALHRLRLGRAHGAPDPATAQQAPQSAGTAPDGEAIRGGAT